MEPLPKDKEPPTKKPKIEDDISKTIDSHIKNIKRCKSLKAILGDDFEKPVPLIQVYVGHVRNPKDLSKTILILNEKVPLKGLHHLKRVRKREVLLCPTHYLNGMSSIQEYLEINVPELKDIFEYFKDLSVPMYAPKVKRQYNQLLWSCNFHPNKYYEKLVSDNFFSNEEMKLHTKFMTVAFEVQRWHLKVTDHSAEILLKTNATVIVDPSTDSVVAASFFNGDHPVQHSAMLAIDNVAKTQQGGAWGTRSQTTDCALSGVDSELLIYLKENFPKVKFGARPYKSKRDVDNEDSDTESPYLCTGYNIYMLKEPCIMCSMALVHARAKRIFYCFSNLKAGGLKSRTKLQGVPSLNHHFEVFSGFL
ncbi:probable inactive tRNA-specific adenosine deaminase-like protein 3 [Pectinophora gossypiella]|uniref:probable inactive tRNA-specific adenosine deaminase-like protein 3 n=1 Tax=Pectinophora gossypiella TaxID=13191 RepID=UPI00214E125F|nr:probable inactive tRNA-specific adenosine deaminase-like protein 3 [Pectinophora gossypiella]